MKKSIAHNKGIALLMAVIITTTLMLVSFALSHISLKELLLSHAGQESQVAFYAADTGIECALFWDTKNPDDELGLSAFATSTASTIRCNRNIISATSDDVPSIPNPTPTLVGGGGNANATSTFHILIDGPGATDGPCAIVRVGKHYVSADRIETTVESRGYNTCTVEDPRRIERALRVVY